MLPSDRPESPPQHIHRKPREREGNQSPREETKKEDGQHLKRRRCDQPTTDSDLPHSKTESTAQAKVHLSKTESNVQRTKNGKARKGKGRRCGAASIEAGGEDKLDPLQDGMDVKGKKCHKPAAFLARDGSAETSEPVMGEVEPNASTTVCSDPHERNGQGHVQASRPGLRSRGRKREGPDLEKTSEQPRKRQRTTKGLHIPDAEPKAKDEQQVEPHSPVAAALNFKKTIKAKPVARQNAKRRGRPPKASKSTDPVSLHDAEVELSLSNPLTADSLAEETIETHPRAMHNARRKGRPPQKRKDAKHSQGTFAEESTAPLLNNESKKPMCTASVKNESHRPTSESEDENPMNHSKNLSQDHAAMSEESDCIGEKVCNPALGGHRKRGRPRKELVSYNPPPARQNPQRNKRSEKTGLPDTLGNPDDAVHDSGITSRDKDSGRRTEGVTLKGIKHKKLRASRAKAVNREFSQAQSNTGYANDRSRHREQPDSSHDPAGPADMKRTQKGVRKPTSEREALHDDDPLPAANPPPAKRNRPVGPDTLQGDREKKNATSRPPHERSALGSRSANLPSPKRAEAAKRPKQPCKPFKLTALLADQDDGFEDLAFKYPEPKIPASLQGGRDPRLKFRL